MRYFLASLLLLGCVLNAPAQTAPAAGNWTVTIVEEGQEYTLWIVSLQNMDGKLAGKAFPMRRVRDTELSGLRIAGDQLQFSLKMNGTVFGIECKLPQPGAKKMYGSATQGASVNPVILQTTTASSASDYDKELLTRYPNDPRVFDALNELLKEAEENKYSVKQVQEWVQTALQSAKTYGARWQMDVAVNLANTLVKQKGYEEVAVEAAQSAASLAGTADTQMRALDVLKTVYERTNQAAKAKALDAQIEKLESEAHKEHNKDHLPFAVKAFPGRKTTSDRAVLVELFTGAQCPPCVAADMAFDGLEKAFKPADVVLLQYHLHIPGPDALTNADTEARQQYYDKFIQGTPSIFFNGKIAEVGGGGADDSGEVFEQYLKILNPLLEQPASGQLKAAATRDNDKVSIRVQASEVKNPGPKVKLRIALVEDWARYRGRNGLTYHHRIVRAFPGGVEGVALTKQDLDHSAVIDLTKLRLDLGKYLNEFAANQAPFPDAQRPMRLSNLSVVAFIQNDENFEVLQAIDVPVK